MFKKIKIGLLGGPYPTQLAYLLKKKYMGNELALYMSSLDSFSDAFQNLPRVIF